MSDDESSKDEEKKFKVTDRRRFDSEGSARSDSSKPEGESEKAELSKEAPAADSSQQQRSTDSVGQDGSEELSFNSFIMSLATQALMLLGEVPAPPGTDLEPDLPAAKQTIDVLDMLGKKTKGNLDPSEERLLTDVIHNLKLSFVSKSSS